MTTGLNTESLQMCNSVSLALTSRSTNSAFTLSDKGVKNCNFQDDYSYKSESLTNVSSMVVEKMDTNPKMEALVSNYINQEIIMGSIKKMGNDLN